MYALLYETVNYDTYLARISSGLVYYTLLNQFSVNTNNIIYNAYLKSSTNIYYAGYTKNIANPSTTLSSYKVAFIMAYD
jgi:hypothetical protein